MLARAVSKAGRPAVRSLATAVAQPAAAAAAPAAADPEHAQWLKAVATYPVVIPHFEWTLEWALPTPVPLHQFTQSPVAVEVTDRTADPDALIYSGPNVVGGYTHPLTGKPVSQADHAALVSGSPALEAKHASKHAHAGAAHHAHH